MTYKTMDDLQKKISGIAQEYFAVPSLLPIQHLVITTILDSLRNTKKTSKQSHSHIPHIETMDAMDAIIQEKTHPNIIVMLPTGTGKSICFQVPAIIMKGIHIFVYPLTSLVKDQYRRMQSFPIPVYLLQGGMAPKERANFFDKISKEQHAIVVSTPEALQAHTGKFETMGTAIGLLVVDEAHCISKWGTTFRPSYLALKDVKMRLNPRTTFCCTATATPKIIEDISKTMFSDQVYYNYSGNPDRKNVSYKVYNTIDVDTCLLNMLKEARPQYTGSKSVAYPVLVFARTRKSCHRIAQLLRLALGRDNVYYYHAGMSRDERTSIEKWFFDCKQGILVSTSAYGMGIDKKDIRTVIHYGGFTDESDYLQETGRAGRDGHASHAILLNQISADDVSNKKNSSKTYSYSRTCRREYLLRELVGTREDEICGGCDNCTHDHVSTPLCPHSAHLLALLRRFPRTLTIEQLVILLLRAKPLKHGEREYQFFFESLSKHCKQLVNEGILYSGKLFWKNKIRITKKIQKIIKV